MAEFHFNGWSGAYHGAAEMGEGGSLREYRGAGNHWQWGAGGEELGREGLSVGGGLGYEAQSH